MYMTKEDYYLGSQCSCVLHLPKSHFPYFCSSRSGVISFNNSPAIRLLLEIGGGGGISANKPPSIILFPVVQGSYFPKLHLPYFCSSRSGGHIFQQPTCYNIVPQDLGGQIFQQPICYNIVPQDLGLRPSNSPSALVLFLKIWGL